MVVKGDFEIQLVHATSKEPFLEHRKGDEVYVEVEPEVEYFIALRKVRASDHRCLYCHIHVDGVYLGYYLSFLGGETELSCRYHGTYSRVNTVASHKALKFMKPKEDKTVESTGFMGKVELWVYEGKSVGIHKRADFSRSIDMKPVETVDEDKTLRTTEGHTVIHHRSVLAKEHFRRGAHLYTITLQYCTTPGLIKAGILRPPPDSNIWKKRSASSRKWMKNFPTPKRIAIVTQSQELDVHDVNHYDYFDLSGFSSGDDDDDDSSQEEESGTQKKALEGNNGMSDTQAPQVMPAAGDNNDSRTENSVKKNVSGTKKTTRNGKSYKK